MVGNYMDIIGAGGGAWPGYGPAQVAIGADGAPMMPIAPGAPGIPPGALVATPDGLVPAGAGWGPWGGCGPLANLDPNFLANVAAAREAFVVAPKCPTVARREPLGFGLECVGPCETVTIQAEPQVLFKAYRLLIPSDVAFYFQLHEVKIGKWNLFANGGSVPAAAFIETATDTDFNADTLMPSGKISLTVENVSDSKQQFKAVVFGKAVE